MNRKIYRNVGMLVVNDIHRPLERRIQMKTKIVKGYFEENSDFVVVDDLRNNQNLMEAAPELLAAVKFLMGKCSAYDISGPEAKTLFNLINKAEGSK